MLVIGIFSGLLAFVLSKDLLALTSVFLLGLISIIYSFSILFVYPIMFLKGEGPWKSIKLSFEYFKKKVKHVIFVWFIVTITSYIITNILGYVIELTDNLQVVIPINVLGFLFVGVWSIIYLFKAL